MADPTALQTAVAAAQAVEFVGLPEARINLAQAVIHIALAPKSNAVVKAIGAAQADVQAGLIGAVPNHLRDAHYAGAKRLGHGKGYVYPHDRPEGIVGQQYAPDAVNGRAYYEPSSHGMEARFSERARLIREILHPETGRRAGRGSRRRGSRGERARQWGREVSDPRSCDERDERDRNKRDRNKREGIR